MARVLITEAADADVDGIIFGLAVQAGRQTALKYEALFDRLYVRLADHPASGAPRPLLGRHIRIGIVSPFIVIYQHAEAEDTVTVLRVVHGRRRISGQLLRTVRQQISE